MKTSDAQLEKFRCVKCNFQGFYAQQYQRHIATHSDDVIKCKCCPFLAFSQEDILEHFKVMNAFDLLSILKFEKVKILLPFPALPRETLSSREFAN